MVATTTATVRFQPEVLEGSHLQVYGDAVDDTEFSPFDCHYFTTRQGGCEDYMYRSEATLLISKIAETTASATRHQPLAEAAVFCDLLTLDCLHIDLISICRRSRGPSFTPNPGENGRLVSGCPAFGVDSVAPRIF